MTFPAHETKVDKASEPAWLGYVCRVTHVLIAILVSTLIWQNLQGVNWKAIESNPGLFHNSLVAIALPSAAGGATILVSGFRALDGTFKLDLLGVRARGASGALIAWICAFAAIVVAFRILW